MVEVGEGGGQRGEAWGRGGRGEGGGGRAEGGSVVEVEEGGGQRGEGRGGKRGGGGGGGRVEGVGQRGEVWWRWRRGRAEGGSVVEEKEWLEGGGRAMVRGESSDGGRGEWWEGGWGKGRGKCGFLCLSLCTKAQNSLCIFQSKLHYISFMNTIMVHRNISVIFRYKGHAYYIIT